jgi:hypothetical protein
MRIVRMVVRGAIRNHRQSGRQAPVKVVNPRRVRDVRDYKKAQRSARRVAAITPRCACGQPGQVVRQGNLFCWNCYEGARAR